MRIVLENLSVWAGALMSIFALIAFILRPVLKMMDNLTKMGHNLDLLNRDLAASKSDREMLHKILENHETRLDAQNIILVQHTMLFDNLKNGGNRNGTK